MSLEVLVADEACYTYTLYLGENNTPFGKQLHQCQY